MFMNFQLLRSVNLHVIYFFHLYLPKIQYNLIAQNILIKMRSYFKLEIVRKEKLKKKEETTEQT